MKDFIELIEPQRFEPENHFYPKALNAHIHPLISHFFSLGHERIIKRYSHLNPLVDAEGLRSALSYRCRHFFWGGSDLFYATTNLGKRQMVVLETNSCPSGQKSLPALSDDDEYRGYRKLIEQSFLRALKGRKLPKGEIAVIYDKNYMEVSGYAAALADILNQKNYLIPCYSQVHQQHISYQQGVMLIDYQGQKIPIRAAFRYVTQKPWNRLPLISKTFIFNSTLVCLAGGRNKLVASKAYELYNSQIKGSGLEIRTPQTIRDISKPEIPLWVKHFGGYAVIKNPYSNAGQGVYTITSQEELDEFMSMEHNYSQFIVQSLIGHSNWSSVVDSKKYYHIGTIPNKKEKIYVADLRMMIYSSEQGLFPCAIYARRAKNDLQPQFERGEKSWDVLGTNLSIKEGVNTWSSDTNRLVLMDRREFNSLGIGVDDLIEAYIQTALSVIAIDQMAINLLSSKGKFKHKLFRSLDNDQQLINEILIEGSSDKREFL